jgi:hypothetical protein
MRLCHSTDQAGKSGIEVRGFTQADPPEGPAWTSPDRGIVWFASSKEIARETCPRHGWWVWIEVPDETPEHALDDGSVYAGNYSMKIDYVNTLVMGFEEG